MLKTFCFLGQTKHGLRGEDRSKHAGSYFASQLSNPINTRFLLASLIRSEPTLETWVLGAVTFGKPNCKVT